MVDINLNKWNIPIYGTFKEISDIGIGDFVGKRVVGSKNYGRIKRIKQNSKNAKDFLSNTLEEIPDFASDYFTDKLRQTYG